jgi:hypothetical protein
VDAAGITSILTIAAAKGLVGVSLPLLLVLLVAPLLFAPLLLLLSRGGVASVGVAVGAGSVCIGAGVRARARAACG